MWCRACVCGDGDAQLVDAAAALRHCYPLAGIYTSAVGPPAGLIEATRHRPRDDEHREQRIWTAHHLAVAHRDTADLLRALVVLQDEGALSGPRPPPRCPGSRRPHWPPSGG
ncbi:hypothetical protein LWP59_23460 [Amycolatopsis acidiphila]|uniref:hypothetical protein n=1 Tax=Amycolatopsis acidiphila TaxID=715473 RepID=UPI0019C34880|nr:hypothetical protein [Amycolatopsis acidiphila]UIJ57114.1 hypothetical protein LWP59_23460 [Amycolatopsis acidiphila]GHG53283.1 hypothetical protein GCM10017788_01890 [Amycolatopsis acidiphila]